MDIGKLRGLLEKNNIVSDEYILPPDRPMSGEAISIIHHMEDGRWKVYCDERGTHFDVCYCDTEHDACIQFLKDAYPSLLNQI